MNIDNKILVDFLVGELLPESEEAKAVSQWINESPDNIKFAEQVYFVLKGVEQLNTKNSVNAEEMYAKFEKIVRRQRGATSLKKIARNMQRVAAVLFIPLLLGLAYTLYPSDAKLQFIEVSSKPGMISTVDLPDGTKVHLNAGSTLKYPVAFNNDSRTVDLSGRAYFDVVKDAKRPFVVMARDDYSVEVLGTEFDMSAYIDDSIITTTLVEGSVKVILPNGDNAPFEKVLKPNQKASFDLKTNKMVIAYTNTEHESAWVDGKLIFQNLPIEETLKILSRHYNVDFKIMNERVKESRITGKFELPQILEYLRIACDIEYKINKPILTQNSSIKINIIEIK